MGKLDGQVALITGAARGQGRSPARLLAAEGADIVLVDSVKDNATTKRAERERLDDRFLGRGVLISRTWAEGGHDRL